MKSINMAFLALALFITLQSCKKNNASSPTSPGGTTDTTTTTPIVAGIDPSVATTQGFFLDSWSAKTWAAPTSTQNGTKPSASWVQLRLRLISARSQPKCQNMFLVTMLTHLWGN